MRCRLNVLAILWAILPAVLPGALLACSETDDPPPTDAPADGDDASAADGSGDDTPAGSTDVKAAGGLMFINRIDRLVAVPTGVTGVSLADYDGDGKPDVTLADRSGVHLYRNTGAAGFSKVENFPAGPEEATGVVWADFDGDGLLDLFVTTREESDRLIRQTPDGFEDVTEIVGLGAQTWAESATFGDLDGDGDLDLIISQGITRKIDHAEPLSGANGNPNLVYRNLGGFFEEAGEAFGLAGNPTGETFINLIFDFDDDGDQDVLAVHDHLADQLFINSGDGTFEDVSGTLLPTDPTSLMGLDVADFDGDGRLDVYGTTAGRDMLYLAVDGKLVDEYFSTIGSNFDPSPVLMGWGAVFLDADNDGDLDVMTVAAYSEAYGEVGVRPGGLVLMQHEDRKAGPRALVDVSESSGAAFQRTLNGWGLATADIDRDGDVDVLVGVDTVFDVAVVVPEGDEPHDKPVLLMNESPRASGARWLRLALRQPGVPNVMAVGATVTVEIADLSVSRVVTAGVSYASQSEYDLHFGLADNPRANVVRVHWPYGPVALWGGLEAGAHVLERDDSANCCVKGQCQTLHEAQCRDEIASALGFKTGCQAACETLDRCDLLDEEGLDSVEACAKDCAEDPPPAPSLTCLENADCAAASACLADR